MEPKKVEFDGVEFRLNPLSPLKMMRITKNIVQLVGSGMKSGTGVEIMTAVSDGLHSLSDNEFVELALLMFSTTQAITKKAVLEIDSAENFDIAFLGVDIENVFVLMYEVLVYNRFPLVRNLDLNIGELIKGIEESVKEEVQEKSSEESTENLENSAKS